MPKITLKKNECIGCGACVAVCGDFFEMGDDGLAHLKGSKEEDVEELEVKDTKCTEEAIESCPVRIIKVE
ncbi:ferredoxin [Nanoarchaeota archaeon]